MPIYAYKCSTCGKHFEIMARMTDPTPKRGEDCISDQCRLEKIMSQVAKTGGASPTGADRQSESELQPQPKPAHKCGGGCQH